MSILHNWYADDIWKCSRIASQIETGVKIVSPERAKRFAKILGYSEVSFVQLALQDMFHKAGINLKVTLEAA